MTGEPLVYDEPGLLLRLSALPLHLQAGFAAACAERILPAHVEYQLSRGADAQTLPRILERSWAHLLGQKMSAPERRAARERCNAFLPEEGQGEWSDERAYSEDAAAAVAYALTALETGGTQEAAWAARKAYEAFDYYVTHPLAIDDEREVLAHPLIQLELSRQQRDLAELEKAREPTNEVLLRLRDRARQEAAHFPRSSSRPLH